MIEINNFSNLSGLPSSVDTSKLLTGFSVSGTKLKSNTISHSETTSGYMKVTLATAGTVTINYTISSEPSYDFGACWITNSVTVPANTSTANRILYTSGASTSTVTKSLTAGTWYIHFKYFKDASSSRNDDCLYINSITLPIDMDRHFMKINGAWVPSKTKYAKINGAWVQAKSLYAKVNGAWVKSY